MLTGSYRKRLEADLTGWVAQGFVTLDGAGAIRRSLAAQGGFRLPALLGLFGGLLIASSVAAFVAANWEEMPRLAKLAMILIGIVVTLSLAARLEARGSPFGADAAATCGALIFAAGVALVGQMYHLPTDWPGGAFLIALGGLSVALLLRSDGALAVALVAIGVWSFGRWEEMRGEAHYAFFLLWLPALLIALPRLGRAIQHGVVILLGLWCAQLPGAWLSARFDYGLVAYLLAVAALFVAAGAAALDRGWPELITRALPWGLLGLVVAISVELFRILDAGEAAAGTASRLNYVAYGLAVPAILAFAATARQRRFAWPLAGALLVALTIPLVFWSGLAVSLPGKAVVASLILGVAIGLVVAGAAGGVRRLTLAGSGLFAVAILILLWQTIGTLLDQSLFFLVAGAVLLAAAGSARRLFERLTGGRETAA